MSVNLLVLYDDFKQQWSLLYRNVFYQLGYWCGYIYMLQGLFMFLNNNCCSNKKCCQTVDMFFMFCLRDSKEKISANDIESN